MKRVYQLEDLDCANCAAKMERAIAKIDGVTSANVSFMAQRLAIEADESRFDLENDEACLKSFVRGLFEAVGEAEAPVVTEDGAAEEVSA